MQAGNLLSSGCIHVAELTSHWLPLDTFQHWIELIEGALENVRKAIIFPEK
jgi:hypothetical protein